VVNNALGLEKAHFVLPSSKILVFFDTKEENSNIQLQKKKNLRTERDNVGV